MYTTPRDSGYSQEVEPAVGLKCNEFTNTNHKLKRASLNKKYIRVTVLQLCPRGNPFLSLLLSQLSPQNLPSWALWNGVDELDSSLKPLVPGFVLLDVSMDVFCNIIFGLLLCTR